MKGRGKMKSFISSALLSIMLTATAHADRVVSTSGLGAGGTAELADAPYTAGFDALIYMVVGPNAQPIGVVEYNLSAFSKGVWPHCAFAPAAGHVGDWLAYDFYFQDGGSAGVIDTAPWTPVTNRMEYRTKPALQPGDYFVEVHCH